ncbi:MAG: xylose isomerase, partial [Microbacteriaceae bacterium]|nr:xylose isomerase [Microbacteriaceae bacterium]
MSDAALSIQLYTLREALAADLPGTLRRVAEIGFRNVELFGFVDAADQYSEVLPALGLTAPSAHAHLLGEDLEPIFAAAKKIGVTTVIDPHIDRALWTTRDDIAAAAAQLNDIAKVGADHGLTIGYHNHWWETENRIDGTPALEVFAELLDPALILEVDTYWAE